ncbi:hypothetical protein [Marinomonas pollencensis]|uniref:Uncharacterized protein n=1 Tax=Marinomonas pollencensis TaxID=491954 RepID=A0A3E0DMT4_9GAMM|nr:hypothetical protein [Marinomonas pollencensis]REG84186.1 hypothetical protein DFP81_10465 [Marinomonas pollencensis]
MNQYHTAFTPYPIQHELGKGGCSSILHRDDRIAIRHEYLVQSSTPSRFYQAPEKCFIFVLSGDLFLKNQDNEIQLKKHQGSWLPSDSITVATLLSPQVTLCVINLSDAHAATEKAIAFHKVSSGSSDSFADKNGITTWPLYQGADAAISIHLYPAHYKDTPYYHKKTDQYLICLEGELAISTNKQAFKLCPSIGQYLPRMTRKALFNHNRKSITVLSITTPYPEKGRVLAL